MKNKKTFSHKTVAVIGFGRFGKLLVDILCKETDATVILVSQNSKIQPRTNLTVSKELKDITKADIVIPCVPISHFESVIKTIAPLLKSYAIVMDVCSVKMLPVKTMQKHLPRTVQIIASHPMFGPDSYRIKKSLHGLILVLHNIRAKHESFVLMKDFFQGLGLKIVDLTPEDHDKHMAFSLGYSYLLGKISQKVGIQKTPIDTYDFELLLEHVSIIKSDSEQLFIDMQTKNPFAKTMQEQFKKSYDEVIDDIHKRQVPTVKRITENKTLA